MNIEGSRKQLWKSSLEKDLSGILQIFIIWTDMKKPSKHWRGSEKNPMQN